MKTEAEIREALRLMTFAYESAGGDATRTFLGDLNIALNWVVESGADFSLVIDEVLAKARKYEADCN